MKSPLASSVFQKFVMAITGLLLVGFVITHLAGNLLLYSKEGGAFNTYAEKLAALGPLLYIAEIALAAFFIFHAVTGIRLALAARRATPTKYAMTKSKGGNSRWGFAANNMAITGTILFVFLVLHIIHFKYGPGIEAGYVTTLSSGTEARDLHRHVVEQFKNPVMVALYTITMLILGVHLRHGIWSGLHSLGLTRETNSNKIYAFGGFLAILLGLGFLTIPIYIYFFH